MFVVASRSTASLYLSSNSNSVVVHICMSRFTFDSTQSLHAWLIGLSSTVSVYVLFEHASNENNKRILEIGRAHV